MRRKALYKSPSAITLALFWSFLRFGRWALRRSSEDAGKAAAGDLRGRRVDVRGGDDGVSTWLSWSSISGTAAFHHADHPGALRLLELSVVDLVAAVFVTMRFDWVESAR